MVPGRSAFALLGENGMTGAAIALPSFCAMRDHGGVPHQRVAAVDVLRTALFGAAVINQGRRLAVFDGAYFTSTQVIISKSTFDSAASVTTAAVNNAASVVERFMALLRSVRSQDVRRGTERYFCSCALD